jgi:hypothetical protein
VLREIFGEPVRQIALDHRAAGLKDLRLRDLGLSETEIMDVVLAVAARCFFSKTLDALGVRADSAAPTIRKCGLRPRVRLKRPVDPWESV